MSASARPVSAGLCFTKLYSALKVAKRSRMNISPVAHHGVAAMPTPLPKSKVGRVVLILTATAAVVASALVYAHQGVNHHGPMGGHAMEMHLDHIQAMLGRIGASDAQKAQINATLESAFNDVKGLHERHSQVLQQFHELLLAPTVDRARIESLRAEQIKAMDEASRRLVGAIDDAAEILTPDQRAALADEIRKHHEQ
jgi:Spy/CpxP family protein refolding chaperone